MIFKIKYMITKKEYGELVKRASPPSPKIKDFIFAFLIGGFICSLGQLISVGYEMSALDSTSAKIATSVTLVFLAVLFTAFGIFDKIAKVILSKNRIFCYNQNRNDCKGANKWRSYIFDTVPWAVPKPPTP